MIINLNIFSSCMKQWIFRKIFCTDPSGVPSCIESFSLVERGVAINLHALIPTRCKTSLTYFSCVNIILSWTLFTSVPGNSEDYPNFQWKIFIRMLQNSNNCFWSRASHNDVVHIDKEKYCDSSFVRPEVAGLLTTVEWSRIRDSKWYVSYPVVTTRIRVELVA